MLRSLFLLAALALAPFVISAAESAPTGAAAAIRTVMARQQADWNSGNISAFMEGYAQSEQLRFASGGSITYGWAETLARYQEHYDSSEKMGRLNFDILSVDVLSADAAVVFGRWELTLAPEEIKPNGLFTLIFRLTPAGWRIVHDHTSSADK